MDKDPFALQVTRRGTEQIFSLLPQLILKAGYNFAGLSTVLQAQLITAAAAGPVSGAHPAADSRLTRVWLGRAGELLLVLQLQYASF